MNMKKLESGRSMVEMLGVLAIIGVLSVGGIAGYSLSMRRHRANQVVDIASKYALTLYSACQQRVLNGEATSGCSETAAPSDDNANKIYLPFENAGIGALPAGVTGYRSWAISLNGTTGVDTVSMFIDFSDQKLCQAVASTVGSVTTNKCERTTDPYLAIAIKQN